MRIRSALATPGLVLAAACGAGESAIDLSEPITLSQVDLAATGAGLWASWEERGGEVPSILVTPLSGGEAPDAGRAARVGGTNPSVAGSDQRQVVAWLDGEAVKVAARGG